MILEVRNLTKIWPGEIAAVNGVSLSVRSGICFGLLGPNGAGKTTTIEISEGIIPPTSGEVLYKGAPRGEDFREEVGIQFQSTALLNFLSVHETLETFRSLYRDPMPADELIALCRLGDILEQDNDRISGGQKQRLMLAMALVNDPELVFLDEPTTGLDPQARRHLWHIIRSIREKGKTIVLTTHYMDEAQILCDEIAIMDKGRIIAQGEPEDLLRESCSGLTISLPAESFPKPPEQILSGKGESCGEWHLFETRNRLEIRTNRTDECLKTLLENKVDLSHLTVRSQNLEDLFLKLTGHGLRE